MEEETLKESKAKPTVSLNAENTNATATVLTK